MFIGLLMWVPVLATHPQIAKDIAGWAAAIDMGYLTWHFSTTPLGGVPWAVAVWVVLLCIVRYTLPDGSASTGGDER